jgi:Putative threonine/serine exporter
MMMFGGPTHRLQAQIQSTARVLEISLSCLYLPDVMLIAFDDDVTSTSNVKLIRQGSALDLGKVQDAYEIYWRVCTAKVSKETTEPPSIGYPRRYFSYRCLSSIRYAHAFKAFIFSMATYLLRRDGVCIDLQSLLQRLPY